MIEVKYYDFGIHNILGAKKVQQTDNSTVHLGICDLRIRVYRLKQ
jgi:hypothetical protein